MTDPRIFVALPAFGSQVFAACTASLYALALQLGSRGWADGFSTLTFPDIAELRNIYTSLWYDLMPQSTHMLMVDADMEFPPQLVLDMIEFDQPIVGCMYAKKRHPITFVGDPLPDAVPDRGFIRSRYVGGGILLIQRACIDEMLAQMPHLSDDKIERHTACDMLRQHGCKRIIRAFDGMDNGNGPMSEDISFCQRWINCGGEIWAATHHSVAHIGPNAWRASFADAMAMRPEKIGVRFEGG